MKKISVLLVFAMLFSLFSTCAFANDNVNAAGTLAKIAEIRGDASIVNDATKKTVKAFKNMKLSEGDTVVTTKDAQVRLFLENKILVIVEGNSEVVVSKNSKNKVTQGYERLLDLKKGSLVVIADKKLQNKEKLEVKTQTMVAGVRGTSFGIVNKPDHYYIEVYEGVVQLAPNKEYYANDSAISSLKPILITKQRTKLIKYGNFVNDYRLEPKKTQEPLIYPNTLLRFKEEEKYYGKYMAGQKQDIAIKPDSAKTMTSRMGEVLGYNFTFDRAYDFNKKENIVAKNTSTSSNPSSRPEPQTPPSLPSINYYNELVSNGKYKAPVTIAGVSSNVEVEVKNGKIRKIKITPEPSSTLSSANDITRATEDIRQNNGISSSLRNSTNTDVKSLVEAVNNALKKDPEPNAIPTLLEGNNWYGHGRGNERYDWTRPSGTRVGPMEVKITVNSSGIITSIDHENFGDNASLKPESASTDTNTYKPIRDAVMSKNSTDLAKKAVLYGANASGLSDSEKATARNIYNDVINGATDSEQIKKRQKSAIGYISAIDNAIERATPRTPTTIQGNFNVNAIPQGFLRSVSINPDLFENNVYYKSKSENLAAIRFPSITMGTPAAGNGTVTIPALANANVSISGDGFTYDTTNNTLKHDKDLDDYSQKRYFELVFTHPSGFEYATMIPVVRGVDTYNLIETEKIMIGKSGQNYTLPLKKNANNAFSKYYFMEGMPTFISNNSFDVLKIIGKNNVEFDLNKDYNKISGNQLKLEQSPTAFHKHSKLIPNSASTDIFIKNTPPPSEPSYKVSDMKGTYSTNAFDIIFFAGYTKTNISRKPNGAIKIKRGEKLSDVPPDRWNVTPFVGGADQPFDMEIVSKVDNDIKQYFTINNYSDFEKYGLYTKFTDTPVPMDAHTGDSINIKLQIAVYKPDGTMELKDIYDPYSGQPIDDLMTVKIID
ncbi:MAG: FecR family protein [Eubacteriales bacterium]